MSLVGVIAAAAAWGRPPGQWTRFAGASELNIFEPSLARTSDGVLHVAWLKKNGAKFDLMHTAIRPDGTLVGPANAIVEGWQELSNPALVTLPNGSLRVFFGGIRSIDPGETHGELNACDSDLTGENWSLEDGAIVHPGGAAYSSDTAAVLEKDGTPVLAWAGRVHIGADPAVENRDVQTACCAYNPGLATDSATGEVVDAWYSNATSAGGLILQTVAPDWSGQTYLSGSAAPDRNSSLSLLYKTPVVGRIGAPGIYSAYGVGYPSFTGIALWRYHGSAPVFTLHLTGPKLINIAAAPAGRLWILWSANNKFYAARTNRAATRMGPAGTVLPPPNMNGAYKLDGEASRGPLDLFTNASIETEPGTSLWHTQVMPALSLGLSRTVGRGATGGAVTFTVTDAGDPIEGASIRVSGRTLTTDAGGHAILSNAAHSRPAVVTARVTDPGYLSAASRLVIQ